MAISFSQTPLTNPYTIAKPGYYRFTITGAEMRQGKDMAKPPYLNMTYALVDAKGNKAGNVFDRVFDSDKPAVLFKMNRLNLALGLGLNTAVELKDLAKIVINRRGVVEIVNNHDNRYPDDPSRMQAEVAMFGSDIFWPEAEYASLIGVTEESVAAPDSDDPPFIFDEGDGIPNTRTANDY